jgi:hypothetical protein
VCSGVATGGGGTGVQCPPVTGFAPSVNFLLKNGGFFYVFTIRCYGGGLRGFVTSCNRRNKNFIFQQPS